MALLLEATQILLLEDQHESPEQVDRYDDKEESSTVVGEVGVTEANRVKSIIEGLNWRLINKEEFLDRVHLNYIKVRDIDELCHECVR